MNMVLFLLIFSSSSLFALQEKKLCPGIIVSGKTDLDFSENEMRLLCGDKKVKAYRNIPPYEAKFFMTGFLQSRSYLNPKFRTEGDTLYVDIGEKNQLQKIIVNFPSKKEEDFIQSELRRLYQGKDLNPSVLNEMEAESLSILRRRGYPCAKIETLADPSTEKVELNFLRTNTFNFGHIEKEKIEGLNSNALDRFYPFRRNETFDARMLELHEKRLLRQEVVQGSYFLEVCSPEGDEFTLEEKFLPGPPRTLRFGVGASTEIGTYGRIRWSHNRWGEMASKLSATLEASFRKQSLILNSDHFFWPEHSRRSIKSEFEVTRESQLTYEQFLTKLTPAKLKWSRDKGGHRHLYELGPAYEYGTYNSDDKSQSRHFSTVVLESSFLWTNHDYEFYDVHPQEGDELSLGVSYRDETLGFQTRAMKGDFSFVTLKRFATFGRGILIGGLRTIAGTTFISEDEDLESLPPLVKFFGGGSNDIRGFQLNTLPINDGQGALSKLVFKWELRKTYFIIPSLEIFGFLDHGQFGNKSFSTTSRTFFSPGMGLRWSSPIGIVQAFGAKAYGTSPYENIGENFFIGLGTYF
jgi:translocation and assembly module TamA